MMAVENLPYLNEKGVRVAESAWGSDHDMYYHKQSIAHNTMLIYDPKEAQWPANKYEIIFNANGGQGSMNNLLATIPLLPPPVTVAK